MPAAPDQSSARPLFCLCVLQDAVGELGNRPIHLAAAAGHTAVVKLLLRQGANVVSLPMCLLHVCHSSWHHMSVPLKTASDLVTLV